MMWIAAVGFKTIAGSSPRSERVRLSSRSFFMLSSCSSSSLFFTSASFSLLQKKVRAQRWDTHKLCNTKKKFLTFKRNRVRVHVILVYFNGTTNGSRSQKSELDWKHWPLKGDVGSLDLAQFFLDQLLGPYLGVQSRLQLQTSGHVQLLTATHLPQGILLQEEERSSNLQESTSSKLCV